MSVLQYITLHNKGVYK